MGFFRAAFFLVLTLAVSAGFVYSTQIDTDGLHPLVVEKNEYLKTVLVKRGYRPDYFICSTKRAAWANALIPNAAKNSQHLHSRAIDIYIMDVDGDGDWDRRDVDIVWQALHDIDVWHPRYRGGLGTYHNDPFYTARRTLHFDVRSNGSMPRWNH